MKKFLFFFVFLFILILSSCENPLFVEASGLYTVSFETNGGTELQAFRTDKITSSPKTQKEGEDFIGWYTSSRFVEEVTFPFELSENITLYAKWEEHLQKYSVTFETNGGIAIESFYGFIISEKPASSKKGYSLEGWYLDQDFQNPVIFPFSPKDDCTLYAKWAERSDITYIVKHYKQETDLYTYNLYDSEKKTGIFGASTQASAKSYTGFHNKEFKQKVIDDENIILEIYYVRDTTTVIFDANDGSGRTSSQTCYYGTGLKLNANLFTRQNYIFDGWLEITSNSTEEYPAGTNIAINYPHGTVITLYAKWVCGISVTDNTIQNMNLSSLTESCTIKVTGAINQNTLVSLAAKIKTANKNITLDLSETTGLEAIASTSDSKSLFLSCTKLTSIILPSTLTTIGSNAFYNCSSLASVIIPSSVKTIGSSAFAGSGLKEISLNGVITIGNSAFNGCSSLSTVRMSGVTTISNSAFYSCVSLTSITIDAKNIESYAFGNCKTLTSVTFAKTVKKISYNAFSSCSALSSATFLDTNNWYCGSSSRNVTNPASNASNFRNSYNYDDWTKK